MMGISLNNTQKERRVDLWLLLSYLFLVIVGWLNIYSAVYSEDHTFIFDFSQRYGMQFVWICISLAVAIAILYIINPAVYLTLSPIFYIVMLFLLFAVIFLGREVNGSKSWFFIGSFGLQPAEFSKISTSLLLASFMGRYGFSLSNRNDAFKAILIVLIPILLIVMERETGSALVYLGLILVFYLMGLSGWVLVLAFSIIALFITTIIYSPLVALICALSLVVLIKFIVDQDIKFLLTIIPILVLAAFIPRLGVGFLSDFKSEVVAIILIIPHTLWWLKSLLQNRSTGKTKWLLISVVCAVLVIFSVNFLFNEVLQPHQRARIENLLGITEDLQGIGYNVHQSKIAIGSGGLIGKGFLNGTQTKYNFVPEQSTDFIFCTIGEEWGFVGSLIILLVYIFLIIRIIILASKNSDMFTRIYGWCVASIFIMHVFINIGMTMGLVPVIGIPLPFLSYGGSGMLSFTLLLFIFIRLDMNRQQK